MLIVSYLGRVFFAAVQGNANVCVFMTIVTSEISRKNFFGVYTD